jgi:L-iditol 2-dehydrogenase
MIGIAAGQWAKKFGAAKVTVIGRSEDKRNVVETCGLNYAVCIDATNTDEYDFVLEAVGTPNAIELAISATRRGGNLVLMGNPSGDINISQSVYWKILRKQLHLAGTWNSSYDGKNPSDWMEVVSALSDGDMKTANLITHRFPQEKLMDGLQLMRSHREPYCKVMTLWNS